MKVIGLLGILGISGAWAQSGPGSGRWEVATPESQGLNPRALDAAEQYVNENVGGRSCYLVVKNGKIVYEKYRLGRTEQTISELYSHTKSLCSSVYGVAQTQGWTSVFNPVGSSDPNYGTRQCNPNADFQHVLTMTGQSKDMRYPEFEYDTTGTQCLDSLQDTISENNPDGLYAPAWKDKYWAEPLGLEHMVWGRLGYLNCGFSARSSCRDAARVGQLWANNGRWPGHGQMISEEYVRRARTWVFPESGAWAPYGYTLWLWIYDDVDPTVSQMAGANAQCTSISPLHDAIVVSFGQDDYDNCDSVWEGSKYAIVSTDHVLYNATRSNPMPTKLRDTTERAALRHKFSEAELVGMREFITNNTQNFSPDELKAINRRFTKEGGKAIL